MSEATKLEPGLCRKAKTSKADAVSSSPSSRVRDGPSIRRRTLGAFDAAQYLAESLRPALRADHPWPVLPRRVVPHMLIVAALELSNPMTLLVLMKPHDATFYSPHARPALDIGLNDGMGNTLRIVWECISGLALMADCQNDNSIQWLLEII